MELFPIYLFALFLGGLIILMANLPPQKGGTFGDHVVSPKNLPLLVGVPHKLVFSKVNTSHDHQQLWVKAETAAGLILFFYLSRDVASRPQAQIQVSKRNWIGYVRFNFKGSDLESVVLGNGMAYPPENFRGETRALAGRLYQRLYQLGRDSTRTPPPAGHSPNLSG